jgi:2-aminoadipate transaminase
MSVTPKSYIMELISICQDPKIISFASGLPDNELLPLESVAAAAQDLLSTEEGRSSLQYSITEGFPPLREFIADRYRRKYRLDVDPEKMIIVNGSQQCFDLVGKVMLDPGSSMAIEQPGYLGAVQSFSVFEPSFRPVDLKEDGPDPEMLERIMREHEPRLFYSVPNSQNPMGSTYSFESRKAVVDIVGGRSTLVLEDDAYGELCFDSGPLPPLASLLPEQVVLTGSFSKIFSPGMRCGWMAGPPEVMEKVTIAKEATDLHSNFLSQRIIYQWLQDNDLDAHIEMINRNYRAKRDLMIRLLDELMPEGVWHTHPSGGLFVWMTLPEGSTMELFHRALKKNVAIMPGAPFYIGSGNDQGARLNFSTSSLERIEEGLHRLGDVTRQYLRDL